MTYKENEKNFQTAATKPHFEVLCKPGENCGKLLDNLLITN